MKPSEFPSLEIGRVVYLYDGEDAREELKRFNSLYDIPSEMKGMIIYIDWKNDIVTLQGDKGPFCIPFGPGDDDLIADIMDE